MQEAKGPCLVGLKTPDPPAALKEELWDLPGFQSLLRPFRKGISADEFNPLEWENFYSDPTPSQFSFQHPYPFPALGAHSQGLSNIEAFVKEMLLSLAKELPPCSISACLRDRKGKYHLFLQFSGSIFFSEKNTEMERESWQRIIHHIEAGEYVILNGARELAFPLASRFGPLGFLHFRCEDALPNHEDRREMLEKLWRSIRKYGESLLQACIYEQSTRDPESTLLNGMRFQEDLCREMAYRLERKVPMRLILVRLNSQVKAELIAFCGKNLASLFPFPQRSYRIQRNVFGILDTGSLDDLKLKLSEFRKRIHENFSFDISFGEAAPTLDINTPQEWFEQAQRTLY